MDNSRAWSPPIPLFRLYLFAFLFPFLLGPITCTSRNYQSSVNDENTSSRSTLVLPMPDLGHQGLPHSDYRCTSVSLPADTRYIIGYEPRADTRVVHHMILFGCRDWVPKSSWDCKSHFNICKENDPPVFFSWALNASGLTLPPDVGFKVGLSSHVNYLVVQVHYEIMGTPDISDMTSVSSEALVVHLTKQRQKFVAGVFLLGSADDVHPGMKQTFVDTACTFYGHKTIYPFAFRTHSHTLGKQLVAYVVKPGGEWEMIGTRSPQDPQAFYPVMTEKLQVDPHDQLALRCVYNTENKQKMVIMGPESEDEMCNFYIMYYTLNDAKQLREDSCWTSAPSTMNFPAKLPPLPSNDAPPPDGAGDGQEEGTPVPISTSNSDSSVPPMTSILPQEPQDHSTAPPAPPRSGSGFVLSEDWPLNGIDIPEILMGQVVAAAVDAAGDLHVLHRGHVTWEYDSFGNDHTYRHILDGPIKVPIMLQFSSSGNLRHAWGSHFFYMPHGLTIDHEGSFWITDTAMHQVFKFLTHEDTQPNLVLGTAFQPGQDHNSFCQPSSVAVERSGDFYVTDGYCNHRIMKFSATGKLLAVWDSPIEGKQLFIPHKAILNAAETVLYVADRENQRILSYDTLTGSGMEWSREEALDGSPYAISFNGSSESENWHMLGVFGGIRDDGENLMGFTLDKNGRKIHTWGPAEGFTRPHDMTMDVAHNAVYVTEIGPNRIWKFVPYPSLNHISSDLEDFLNTSSHHADNFSTSASGNDGISESDPGDLNDMKSTSPNRRSPGVNASVVVTVVAVIALAIIVAIGVLKEYKYIKFKGWRLLYSCRKDTMADAKPESTTVKKERGEEPVRVRTRKKKRTTPYSRLQSSLGPSKLGFSRLRTYDSDSEEEEFPVFNRV